MGTRVLSLGVPGSLCDAAVAGASHFVCVERQRRGRVKLKSAEAENYLHHAAGDSKFRDWTPKRKAAHYRCSQGHQQQQFTQDETSQGLRRPLLSPEKTYLEATLRASGNGNGTKVWVMAASTREELVAAATLRAQIFYSYPQADATAGGGIEERIKARLAHDFLVNDLLKTRVQSEVHRESKFEALGMRMKCLLAVCQQSALESLSFPGGRAPALHSHLKPPTLASVDMNHDAEPLVAIGTLDIQVLKGKKGAKEYFPVEQVHTLEQAYIFNVCVVEDARRMGVAKALMVAALKVAKQMELQILFVHVEADNVKALALYSSLGYVVEEEEAVEVESLLKRPRRILLSFWVV